MSPGLRDSIIELTVRLVRENYADSVAAHKLASAIDARWRRGAYARIDSAAALTESLTTQMRQVHADSHLRLDYFVVARPMRATAGQPTPEDLERRRRESARRGYGIERVERLPGNVAVLSLRSFEPLAHAGASLSAAMALTASADGLIIDLRQNGGGYGDTVAELQRYFLPADAPMSEHFDRPSGKTYVGRMSKTVPTHHFGEKPLYILTSKRTFSGAEAFAYSMQARGRGTVVGETSRGGANPVQVFQLSPNFALFLPTGRAIDAITRTNWEGTGVRPDQPVDASEAQAVAYRHLLELLSSRATDPTVRDELRDAMARPAPPSTPKP